MADFAKHDKLHDRYTFTCTLKMETPLRISTGVASEETDAPVARLDGQPYIPGSSLRGAIRSELERVLAAVGPDNGIDSCTLFDDDSCDKKYRDMIREIEADRKSTDEKKKKKIDDFLATTLCPICRLFGATMFGSRLAVYDAKARKHDGILTQVRDSVAIHRDNGAAVDGAKFDYEVVEKAPSDFEFKMVGENLDDTDKRIVNIVLALLKNGIHVGGKRSGGLGRVRLTDYKVHGFEDPKQLWKALVGGKDIDRDITKNWKEAVSC